MKKLKIDCFVAILIFGLIPFHLFAKSAGAGNYAGTSVLSTGSWYRMKVDNNGIYKLTYDEIKKYISDPSKVKIYGYGGWMLDEDFGKPYTDDLPEVSVYVSKGADGVFNSGDFLLFYGRGTVKWSYSQGRFEHENNPYATCGYYFLTEGDAGPKEMKTVPSFSGPEKTLLDFDDYALHERELSAFASTGRELFGESFSGLSGRQQFSFSVPGITSNMGVRFSFAAASSTAAPVALSIGDNTVASMSIFALSGSNTYRKAYLKEAGGNYRPEDGNYPNPVNMTVTYGGSGQGYLNFIALFTRRSLQFYNTPFTFFRNTESIAKDVRYTLSNANASCMVWDITGNYDVQLMQTSLEGSQLSFATQADGTTLREYAMVNLGGAFPSPEIAGEKIPNQNLHALPQPDMVIISPAVYLQQAGILAEKHRTKSGLKVEVVEEKQIFNEFSSGTPDATAYRRLMKMFYDRAAGEQDKQPKYLLLFGDGLFDNRHLTSTVSRIDPKYYLLTYQMKESVDETASYSSDDYFGLLEDNSGTSLVAGKLCLGIGRFPVSSVSQAEAAVNKVVSYMDNMQGGNWKSKLVFTADNTDSSSPGNFCIHATQSNQLAGYMDGTYPEYILYRYFMDTYQPVSVNGKTTYPDAKKSFLNTLNEGCFLVNYTGHGSTTAWSAEDMLKISDVRQMTFENLPLWITATCDFGWFDGVNASGGEEAFLNKKSGAIALYTTSRVVYSNANLDINDKLIRYLFTTDGTGKHLRLGDVLRKSKNDLSDANKLNYVLLGDPALELNYPAMKVKVETVNGEAVTDDKKYAFKAMEKVTVSGSITDENGVKADGFSGELRTSVFDGKQTTKSYQPDNAGNYFSFNSYPNMVYQAVSHIENGSFEFSFTVPLDISYTVDEPSSYTDRNGRMNFYASSSGAAGQDAAGSFGNYIFSGSSDVDADKTGPEIKEIYLNTAGFRDGDDVNETPYFHARVFDETGINISGSGLGHDVLICIDGNPARTYYRSRDNFALTPDGDDWIIGFSIPELPDGTHTLSFTVWDIMNNPAVDTLHFNVVKGYKPAIFDLRASENPAKTGTTFILSHNLPETLLTVDMRVCDLSGRTVWSRSQKAVSAPSSAFPAYSVDWDLRSNAGNRVQPGIYIYRATVKTESSREVTKAQKIIVLRQ